MTLIAIGEIVVPENRIRREFNIIEISTLSKSIEAIGLLHAIVVRDDGRTLVAGERRLRAISDLNRRQINFRYSGRDVPLGFIPIIPIGSLSGIELREAELQENIMRKDLTWQERAQAISDLHKLRLEQDPSHTKGKTAEEISSAAKTINWRIGEVTENIIAANNLDDEEVKKAKSLPEAIKIIERKKTQEYHRQLAANFNSNTVFSSHRLIQGDLFDELPKLDDLFDCVIFDPPYGMDADTFANQKAVRHSYKDSADYSDAIIRFVAQGAMNALCKEQAHLYMFCNISRFREVSLIFEEAGWYVWKTPLIWYGGSSIGLLPRPDHGPRRTYEAILYAIKGDRHVTGVYLDTILDCPKDHEFERGARKPASVYKNLLSRSCIPGDRVLDPCCGTGPVFPAAGELGLIAVGIELDPEAVGIASSRIESEEG